MNFPHIMTTKVSVTFGALPTTWRIIIQVKVHPLFTEFTIVELLMLIIWESRSEILSIYKSQMIHFITDVYEFNIVGCLVCYHGSWLQNINEPYALFKDEPLTSDIKLLLLHSISTLSLWNEEPTLWMILIATPLRESSYD